VVKFRYAIVRPPSASFAEGLTTAEIGKPDLTLATQQHAAYCAALEKCGLTLTWLETDPRYPDSTFVEDTAVLTKHSAILTRPGAASRRGEVVSVEHALSGFYSSINTVQPPGTLDGGDICQAGEHFFIGLSERTNEEGARQLAGLLEKEGFTSTTVNMRGVEGQLHLKSGMAYLDDRRLILTKPMERLDFFGDFEIVHIDPDENYAANCIRVNDYVLLVAGYPKLESELFALGYQVISLEMSEFQKMDGGMSCLSLRF
jgi:dimethylargininase